MTMEIRRRDDKVTVSLREIPTGCKVRERVCSHLNPTVLCCPLCMSQDPGFLVFHPWLGIRLEKSRLKDINLNKGSAMLGKTGNFVSGQILWGKTL